MASPLSPSPIGAVNIASTSTSPRKKLGTRTESDHTITERQAEDLPSSPFVSNVSDTSNIENISPAKIISQQLSPIKIRGPSPLKVLKCTERLESSQANPQMERNPRKLSSPEKRFPVKVSGSPTKRTGNPQPSEDSNGAEADSTLTVKIFEDHQGIPYHEDNPQEDTTMTYEGEKDLEIDGTEFADETTFSTFSAVPDMTMFARLDQDSTKSSIQATPRQKLPANHVLLSPSGSPTPRRQQENESTTELIIDFTEQFNGITGEVKKHYTSTSQAAPGLLMHLHQARTPSPTKRSRAPGDRISTLIDFDIPPAPTPRSMPTITPRELESLKSAFLSEISSLKASLSGKQAEVQSLKEAVGDAEIRVGDCMERLIEEKSVKEQLAIEKEEWEKRGREMEQVLRNVKEEIVRGERERENLEGRLMEAEMRREAAEIMAQEAETKMAGMRANSTSIPDKGETKITMSEKGEDSSPVIERAQPGADSRNVELAVEKVAKELHALYKSKHENKVAALKKSYEARWDKRVKELEKKIDGLTKENEDLRLGRDSTLSSVVPKISTDDKTEEMKAQLSLDVQHHKELEARVVGLSEELNSMKRDNADLRSQLEEERIEKGELVAACDELLALQELAPPSHPAVSSGVENLRGSVSRVSGLRAPNFSSGSGGVLQPPDGRVVRTERTKSGGAQANRPGHGLVARSGIMSSIEKMGGK